MFETRSRDGYDISVQAWGCDFRSVYVVLTHNNIIKFLGIDDVRSIQRDDSRTKECRFDRIAREWLNEERLYETSDEGEQLVQSLISLLVRVTY